MKQSLDGSLPKMYQAVRPFNQDGPHSRTQLNIGPMGNSHKNHLVWNQQLNQNQNLMEQSLDGPLPKFCPAVTFSHQDGCHSPVALLLKAALIQVSDYSLLGASCFFISVTYNHSFHIKDVHICEDCNSKFVEMQVDASDIYPSTLVFYILH